MVSAERERFLRQACSDDDALRHEVEAWLATGAHAHNFMERPVTERAAAQISGPSSAAPLVHRFGPYDVLAVVGRGGMGVVYLAQDTRLGRRLVVKLLPADLTAHSDRVRRFEREARAASSLNHPNIVTIHDIGESEAGRFIAMELVEGRTLRAVLASGRPGPEAVVRLGEQIARAPA